MITQDQLVDYLKNVSLGDLQSLITTLEDELGVTASAPQMMMTGPNPQTTPVEEKDEFNVVLKGFDDSVPKAKINTIKKVREITGLGLKDAKAAIENAPTVLKEAIPKDQAADVAATLKEVGALVEVS